jgi:hypothetical protein
MKRFTKILIIFGTSLFAFSCKPNCDKPTKIPKDLETIDWENYNDVRIVSMNFRKKCWETNYNLAGKDIKVFGWIFQGTEGWYPPVNHTVFPLIDKEANIFEINSCVGVAIYIRFEGDANQSDTLKTKFSNSDITKKCYVSGKLFFADMSDYCCRVNAEIVIYNADDIHFE